MSGWMAGWIVEKRNSCGIGDCCKAGWGVDERAGGRGSAIKVCDEEIDPRSDKGEDTGTLEAVTL